MQCRESSIVVFLKIVILNKLRYCLLFILFCATRPLCSQTPIAEHPGPLTIRELHNLNSNYRETNLSISPDGRLLYFMSSRGQMPWSFENYTEYKGVPSFDGDIWYSIKEKNDWSKPICLPATVNTANAEDEPNISPDGNFVLFQSWRDSWFGDGGPYYLAELFGEVWGKPEGLKGGINQYFKHKYREFEGYATDGATLSADSKLFLVAVAPEYSDSMDIYFSKKQENGIWSYLKKSDISTPGDERSVFIAGDNQTVYFASDGYGGFGGLDIFKATINEEGEWQDVINIGEPFNTPEDDYNFIVTAQGDLAYFVREGNIFEADLQNTSPLIKPLTTLLINGIVYDMYGRPAESDVELWKVPDGLQAKTKSNSKSGKYAFSLFRKPGRYKEIVKWEDLEFENTFEVDSGSNPLGIAHNIEVRDPSLLFIRFEFDQYRLSDRANTSLDSLARVLKANRNLRMYVGGHTDEKGNETYNMDLSRKRVEQVADYLNSLGIPKGIMKIDYFGESMPYITTGFKKDMINRRVEIRIIDLNSK